MSGKKLFRSGLLLLLLEVFFGALAWSVQPGEAVPEKSCLGIEILSEVDMARFQEYQYHDYSEELKYQGDYAPVDQETSVLYLSGKIPETDSALSLPGQLTLDHPGTQLYFAPDAYWDSLAQAVRNGHRFKLLILNSEKTYMQYDVIFTTLPVISLYGELLYKDTEMRNVLSGRIRMWDPVEEEPLSGRVHWHVRGKSAGGQDKKPWKLSLKDRDGKNNNEDLLGLGSDDDWILNAMNMEDSNVREKLFMELWNEVAEESGHNYPMSRGEYVEVLVNGEYSGLYLLQRRIDGQYLELSQKDVLIKGQYNGIEPFYEVLHAGSADLTLLDSLFYENDVRYLSVHNFIDVSLFLQLFCAVDNQGYKNMYYALNGQEEGGVISLIPWDTDMAFGIEWDAKTDGFIYRYKKYLDLNVRRKEIKSMEVCYPELHRMMSARWQELRQGVFRQEYIYEKMDVWLEMLACSGADVRDWEKWGLYYEGDDTIENLYRFVEERLAVLDDYYS